MLPKNLYFDSYSGGDVKEDIDKRWHFINCRRKDLLWLISLVTTTNLIIFTFIHLQTEAKLTLSALSVLNVLILIIGGVGIIDELRAASEDLKNDMSKVSIVFQKIPWNFFRNALPFLFILIGIMQLYEIWS